MALAGVQEGLTPDVRAALPLDDEHGAGYGRDFTAVGPRAHVRVQHFVVSRIDSPRVVARTIVARIGGPGRPVDYLGNPRGRETARAGDVAVPVRGHRRNRVVDRGSARHSGHVDLILEFRRALNADHLASKKTRDRERLPGLMVASN